MHAYSRREMLERALTVAGLSAAGGALTPVEATTAAQPAAGGGPEFFPGFTAAKVKTSGAEIHVVHGGSGPPVLLLHGAPQTHISWRLVATELAKTNTVYVPDLRGYGASSKPPDGVRHSNYAKRAMALDQVEMMDHFGHEQFPVIGHDRGGRVGHRLALDHAERVTKLAVLDIVPTHYLYTHVTIEFIQAYFHWFNYVRAAPGPEDQLKEQFDAQAAKATTDVQRAYMRAYTDPANIHGMCEDYRAGASIDLTHDAADLEKKIACPLLALWGAKAPMGRLFDVLAIWRERATQVSGKALSTGHNLQEDDPAATLAEIRAFLT
jgi:haloacetate dehalogenase